MAMVSRLPAAFAGEFHLRSSRPRRRGVSITRCSSYSSAADPAWLPELQPGGRSRSIAGVDQAVLVEPWLLADADSRFADYNGVQVHYKIIKQEQGRDETGNFPLVLLHGFGASVFSWDRFMRPLSSALKSTVVAFDRPGFGLTSRPRVLPTPAEDNPYSLDFSASITVAFTRFLSADKVILVGHSAGCIVAADAYLKAPERIAGIVMLAPAIPAPFTARQQGRRRRQERDTEQPAQAPVSRREMLVHLVASLFLGLRAVAVDAFLELEVLSRRLQEMLASFFATTFAFALRSRVAIWMLRHILDGYATKAVRSAWYDPGKVDSYVISGYTKPLRCRNWEQGLLEFVIAMFSSKKKNQRKLAERINEISCPVLIVTGDTDRLVPAWNAQRLSKLFPKSKFHSIKQCGHLPHEETPEEVIRVIGEFISSCLARPEMR